MCKSPLKKNNIYRAPTCQTCKSIHELHFWLYYPRPRISREFKKPHSEGISQDEMERENSNSSGFQERKNKDQEKSRDVGGASAGCVRVDLRIPSVVARTSSQSDVSSTTSSSTKTIIRSKILIRIRVHLTVSQRYHQATKSNRVNPSKFSRETQFLSPDENLAKSGEKAHGKARLLAT